MGAECARPHVEGGLAPHVEVHRASLHLHVAPVAAVDLRLALLQLGAEVRVAQVLDARHVAAAEPAQAHRAIGPHTRCRRTSTYVSSRTKWGYLERFQGNTELPQLPQLPQRSHSHINYKNKVETVGRTPCQAHDGGKKQGGGGGSGGGGGGSGVPVHYEQTARGLPAVSPFLRWTVITIPPGTTM